MAKNDNLSDFTKGIADAIREKKGTVMLIDPQDFESEIKSIETGADVSGVTATQSDVRAGVLFVNKAGQLLYGMVSDKTKTTELILETGSEPQLVPAGQYAENQTYIHLNPNASEIIKAGEVILGIIGTFKGIDTQDATAIAEDILLGKTAYSGGEKITGTIPTYEGAQETAEPATQEKTVNITQNGQTVVESDPGKSLSKVTINTNVSGGGSDKQAEIIQRTVAILTSNDFANVTKIGDYAFSQCKNLTSVIIPSNVTSIGAAAFQECSLLTSVSLPDTLTEMGSAAFAQCGNFSGGITIPGSLTEIPYFAFSSCAAIGNVTISEGVARLLSDCFYNTPLTGSVQLPSTITAIGDRAFGSDTAGTEGTIVLHIAAATPPTLGTAAFGTSRFAKIVVPDSAVTAYKTATNWSAYADIIIGQAQSN